MVANLTSGMRISLRGEDFLVINIEDNFGRSKIVTAEGISELVRGKQFIFDTAVDSEYQIVHPNNSRLIPDDTQGYLKTKLFLETHLRNSTIHSNKIVIAHKAAIDPVNYQFTPTLNALKMPRPRILIADAVGLGKTIEVGIMIAELMKRGKGKRILVIALKSILGQFQQELWARFAIPLVRLDSYGISKIAAELPLNKNPFDYYDKTIISIDTLKNNERFQLFIEKTRWDIIVIDECHTVANIQSLRGELAQLLSTRCESLILTSATPHNGVKENFANLIRMIEPIAIPQSGNYTKEDVSPYYVRRFKKDLHDSVQENFQNRVVQPLKTELLPSEKEFLRFLADWKQEEKDKYKTGGKKESLLFVVGVLKAYLSSPEAALQTLENRRTKRENTDNHQEMQKLDAGIKFLHNIIDRDEDSKFKRLMAKLEELNWRGRESDPRILIFTERIKTLEKLESKLKEKFGDKGNRIECFHGSMSDVDQEDLVKRFSEGGYPIRMLLSSDAGSQGVNLHHMCNIMFNYDIPWSFITLEQRNGRIDRFGQKLTPYIYYLISTAGDEPFSADLGILEKLIVKEDEIYRVLGDASSYLKKFSAEGEEEIIENMIISGDDSPLESNPEDLLSALFGDQTENTPSVVDEEPLNEQVSLYLTDLEYYKDLTNFLTKSSGSIPPGLLSFDDKSMRVKNDPEFDNYLFDIPDEATPNRNDVFILTSNKEDIVDAISDARTRKGEWPRLQLLYDLHPVVRMLMFRLEANIDKDVVPVSKLGTLPEDQAWYVFHGQISNRYGQAIISEFFVVGLNKDKSFCKLYPFAEFIQKFNLDMPLINRNMTEDELDTLRVMIPVAVENAELFHLEVKAEEMKILLQQKQAEYKSQLEEWRKNSVEQIEIEFQDKAQTTFTIGKMERLQKKVENILSEKSRFYHDLTSLDNTPYLKLLTIFYNGRML